MQTLVFHIYNSIEVLIKKYIPINVLEYFYSNIFIRIVHNDRFIWFASKITI